MPGEREAMRLGRTRHFRRRVPLDSRMKGIAGKRKMTTRPAVSEHNPDAVLLGLLLQEPQSLLRSRCCH